MTKLLKIMLVMGFFILGFSALGFSEDITISTYYPSPMGVYRVLKLDPGVQPAGNCQNGEIYYKGQGAGVLNRMYLCINQVWERLILSGETTSFPGRWTESGGNIYNTALGGNVSMGASTFGNPLKISYAGTALHVITGDVIFQGEVAIKNAAPAYIYNLEVNGRLHADHYFSGDGSQGMSGIIPVLGNAGSCTISVKDGLVVLTGAGC